MMYADKLPVVKADKTLLSQLFTHLIRNSIKFNQSENPYIHICSRNDDYHYRFEVSDNGIGIPKEYREKVFIIFQRLHGRNDFKGAGVGLAFCKKIVDSLNGRIWIEDSKFGGTKVVFTVPK